jgi:hypothetical protein
MSSRSIGPIRGKITHSGAASGHHEHTMATIVCIIVVLIGAALGVAVAATSGPAMAPPAHAQPIKKIHRYGPYWAPVMSASSNPKLPFKVDTTSLVAFGGCLVALGSWGIWQTKRRCTRCGYCPAFCGCDELTDS